MRHFLILISVLVLAVPRVQAGLRISEFLAENDGFLRDADGDTPDWIEIHNDGLESASLTGWYLTDESSHLTKWAFPVTALLPDEYLLVFASGKDRAVSGQELHSNFQLQNNGDYLALVAADGVTVIQEFSPAFPPQRANVSFGAGRESLTTSLLGPGAAARILIPSHDSLGDTWKLAGFDDSAWLAGPSGIGFDTLNPSNSSGGSVVLRVDFNARGNSAGVTESGFNAFEINTSGGSTAIQTPPTLRTFGGIALTVANTPPDGYDDRLRSTPINTGSFTESLLLRDFVFSRSQSSNGGLDLGISGLPPGQAYTVTLWSFDTSSAGTRVSDWFANGSLAREDYTFGGQNPPVSNEEYQFSFSATANASGAILISGRRDSASVDGAGAASFGVFVNALQLETAGYRSQIATDVETAMHDQNASAFIRLPFSVSDPASFGLLKLRIKYDDGFVAFINGQQVAARNAPGSLVWNSTATAAHSAGGEEDFDEIIFTNAPGLLAAGANVLAVQGLNVSAADPDFLIALELETLVVNQFAGRYFAPPTPGVENGHGFSGFVADTRFSVDRGFFDAPFSVEINCATTNAEIRWTTDGSEPAATTGIVYTEPITVTNTTYLRAAAFYPGLIPSDVDTHTYIFLDQVLQQAGAQPGYPAVWQASYPADYEMDPNVVNDPRYRNTLSNDLRSIPTLSIVADHDDLWGSSGIYPNAVNSGLAWERAASVELIHPDGSTEFAVKCGLRMQGNASRDNARTPKHSFRLLFKHEYGPTKLNYRWFPESPVNAFDNIVLRACFTDAWTTRYSPGTVVGERYRPEDSLYLRDIWMKDSQLAMGSHSARNNFVHLYVNGLYWGLYNPCERLDDSHWAQYFGGRDGDWDVIRDFNELMSGSRQAWDELVGLVNAGITTEAAYQAVADQVDIENLIDYMMLHFHAEPEDWPHHNWYAAHRRATNGIPGAKWIFAVWDQEIIADQLYARNRLEVDNDFTPARLYSQLRAWPEFRRLFGDRVQKHFFNGGALMPENCVARLQARALQIDRAIVGESARWGDAREFPISPNDGTGVTLTRDDYWIPELESLYTNWFPRQQAISLQRFRAAGLYPNLTAPEFSQWGGAVPLGFSLEMTHTNAAGALFFTLDGSDPRIYGTGNVGASAQSYSEPIILLAPALVRARVRNGSEWSAMVEAAFFPPQDLSPLKLTEIMYNPPAFGAWSGNDVEFIELKNTGSTTLDLSGLTFTAGITCSFTNGTRLAPGQFLVLVRNAAAFRAKYPSVTPDEVYSGRLDNGGETLRLSTATGSTVFAVTYNTRAPWPIAADNFDFSLVPRDPVSGGNSDNGAGWRAGSLPGGSPGTDDPLPSIPSIFINEVLTYSVLPDVDLIELFNPNAVAVNLGGWFLSDDGGNPMKFRIPDGTVIAAGEYQVFTEADFNARPGDPSSFALRSAGDAVYLSSGDASTNLTGYSHGFVFGAAAPGVSFGRYVNSVWEEHFPAQLQPTPGASNSGPRLGPVVIQEIMYHPDATGDEFVELRNLSDTEVPLFDAVHSTNTWRVNGLGFTFPMNGSLPANGLLLLVGLDPVVFRAKYEIPPEVQVIGPFPGALQDSGERLELQWPGWPDTNGFSYITMDEARYNDKFPWPPAADGGGPSLQRRDPFAYGNDPLNWVAALPTPGFNFVPGQPPMITAQPQSQTIVAFQNLTLHAAAVGTEPLYYQWLFNGATIAGATNASLVLSNAQPSQAGRYQAVVYNATGSTNSLAAEVTILIPAIILQPPQSVAVPPGEDVTFSVAAAGTGELIYQWYRNGIELVGETNTVLALNNVQPGDTAEFIVVITDEIGSISSEPASLAVLVAPTIVQGPIDLTVLAGESAAFTVVVSNTATLPVSYRWRLFGRDYTNLILHSHTGVLRIASVVSNEHAGRWDVAITNQVGRALGLPPRAMLTVLQPPLILRQPVSQVVHAGESVNFSVEATGNGPLGYQWWRNETNQLEGATGATLDVANAQWGVTDGNYTVVITNDYGMVTSQVARLSVRHSPVLLISPSNQVITVCSSNALFAVAVEGGEPYGFQWYFNQTHAIPDATNATLEMLQAQAAQFGSYSLVVTNPLGVLTSAVVTLSFAYGDCDEDGMPDEWELANGLDPANPDDRDLDLDADGLNNIEEFLAGTDARDANSSVRVDQINADNGRVRLEFLAISNRAYTVLFKDFLGAPAWLNLTNIAAHATNRRVRVTNEMKGEAAQFYRIVTPEQ